MQEKEQDVGIYDIAVIGLGVAGSNLCARLKSHLKVIAIDKKDSQGDCFDEHFHKPCGGLLSAGGQKALAKQGINLPSALLVKEQIFTINTIDFGFDYASHIQKHYINMERHRFDLWLKSLIAPHIHSYHKAFFKTMKKGDDGYFHISFLQKQDDIKHIYKCRARIVVGADGATSQLRKYCYPKLKTKRLVCVQEWYKERNSPMLSCIFDKELTTSYSWTMSKDDFFIFGGAYPRRAYKQAFIAQKARLKTLGFIFDSPLKTESCNVLQPTRMRDFVRGHSGVFLIGEAAGFVNASTLEGISGALHSSQILSDIFNGITPDATQICGESTFISKLHRIYTKRTRLLALKTLFRHYVRYPFMFITPVRRVILRLGILSVRRGLKGDKIL